MQDQFEREKQRSKMVFTEKMLHFAKEARRAKNRYVLHVSARRSHTDTVCAASSDACKRRKHPRRLCSDAHTPSPRHRCHRPI